MISEKQLSEYLHSFWQEHFPLLDSTFVKRFNVEQKERLTSDWGSPVLPIPMGTDIDRFDLVAELAFELAIESYKGRNGGIANIVDAVSRALKKIALLKRVEKISDPTDSELIEASALFANYEWLFQSIVAEGTVNFHPRIKGVGILNEMEADLCTSRTLIEVKAVNRNIQWRDLRQIICYMVAGLGSRQYIWSHYCIFNPRLAVFYTGRIDDFLGYLSGRTAPECISDFLGALMDREQPIEAKF